MIWSLIIWLGIINGLAICVSEAMDDKKTRCSLWVTFGIIGEIILLIIDFGGGNPFITERLHH